MSATLILFFLASITTISLAVVQWRKERYARSLNTRRSNNWILFFSILGSLLAVGTGFWQEYQQGVSEEKLEAYRGKFERSQATALKLSQQIIDSAGKTLQGYIKLDKANSTIIDLQNSTLLEINGGNNRPILLCGYSISYGLEMGKTDKRNYINFGLKNSGKSNLKNVQFVVRDIYKKFNKIQKSNEFGDIQAIGENENIMYHYDSNVLLLDINQSSKDIEKVDVANLDRNKLKTVYETTIPNNGNLYHYVANVEWSNGSYTAKISLKEFDSVYYYRRYEILENNIKVKNLTDFFGLPKIKIPKYLVYSGKVNYGGDDYEIYWNSTNFSIIALNRSSIYYNIFDLFKPKTSKEALSIALPTLIKVFGKDNKQKPKGINAVTGQVDLKS
ncbi:hypothetical protein DBR43_07810 [Pedobacter sp. KBW06]|uniref:hypothetical protein n=1 Tax=Pedobacter sp. KBW06 TaxID=2153359 RepID=UPI000F595BE6|nr:hypothetical protein [Pedobacter sp. KBW06]RQO75256.1 hypothetical protein DBR43_07810 [Pedobacter sp. KBW06]